MIDPTDPVSETARATQEVAKAAGKAIDATATFGGFISQYIGTPIEEAIGIFSDKLKYYRWENQVRLMARARGFLAEMGVKKPNRPIPLKLAIPLLEGASLEDDPELQDLWAKLLVNGANSGSGVELRRAFISILEQLSSLEAVILDRIYSLPFQETQHQGVFTAALPDRATVAGPIGKPEGKPTSDVQLALANLARLGCVAFGQSWGGGEIATQVNPTILGRSFVTAYTLRRNEI